jgi:hypothetical protein
MIPVPVQKIDTLEDKREEYLKEWNASFNKIDSKHIKACMEGEHQFPGDSFYSDIEKLSESVHYLEDNYKIAIFIELRGEHLCDVGSQAYCCEGNIAFGDSTDFIDTVDNRPYVNSESILKWNELYQLLIKLTNEYRGRIPAHLKEPPY